MKATASSAVGRMAAEDGAAETVEGGILSPLSTRRKESRRRIKVSFSEDVLSKDEVGDGNTVDVQEEQGVFLGPLLGRVTILGDGLSSHLGDAHTRSEVAVSQYSSDALKGAKNSPHSTNTVDFDNLVIRMGLLKCGHRYRLLVPVPNHWENPRTKTNENAESVSKNVTTMVRVIEDSLDGHLRGEIVRKDDANIDDCDGDSPSQVSQNFVNITLSATGRGPYRGRFALELMKAETEHGGSESTEAETEQPLQSATKKLQKGPNNSLIGTSNPSLQSSKCIMSVQVDATIMGKDMGTPKLRNGVVCLGKIVGYDSDDETEWQGFD